VEKGVAGVKGERVGKQKTRGRRGRNVFYVRTGLFAAYVAENTS